VLVPRRLRVHGVAHFPGALAVRANALGLDTEIRCGDVRVGLWLPEEVDGHLVEPTSGRRLRGAVAATFANRWGYRSTTDVYYVEKARATFLITPADRIHDAPEFAAIGDGFKRWFLIAAEWLSAWERVPTLFMPSDDGESAFHVEQPVGMAGTGITAGGIVIKGDPACSRSELLSAFGKASAGQRLPPEHRLLLDAQAAVLRGDLRRAVIDAGTATEVALASAIASELGRAGLTAEFIDNVIKNANGVVGLGALYRDLVGALPMSQNRIAGQLAVVRNGAAHGGHEPSPAETTDALKHARDLVRTSRPLPAP
jgi:hypothetical protein